MNFFHVRIIEDQNSPDVQWCTLSLIARGMNFLYVGLRDSLKPMYEVYKDIGYRTHIFYFEDSESTDVKNVERDLVTSISFWNMRRAVQMS